MTSLKFFNGKAGVTYLCTCSNTWPHASHRLICCKWAGEHWIQGLQSRLLVWAQRCTYHVNWDESLGLSKIKWGSWIRCFQDPIQLLYLFLGILLSQLTQTGLFETEIYSLPIPEAGSWKSRCHQIWLFLEALRENLSCLSPKFWQLPANLGVPWLIDASFQSLSQSFHALLPLYVSQPSPSSLIRILVNESKVHPISEWSHPGILDLMTFTKTVSK